MPPAPPPARRPSPWIPAALAIPVLLGITAAVHDAWLCDDIFVSFRYVDEWMQGHGLVFNPGERVAGYTHFLWVVLLAAGRRLGFALPALGRVLPLLAWIGVLAVLFVHAWQSRARTDGTERGALSPAPILLGLPVAAWALALHRDAEIYATSGLETSFFAFLLVAGLLCIAGRRPRLELGAAVYALATLVRPEGALYTATAALFVLAQRRSLRAIGRPAFVWLGLVLPFVLWTTWYYGTPIPNTYYAKSAGLAYWSQGWVYTRLYFTIYAVLVFCVVVALAGWWGLVRREPATAPVPRSLDGSRGLVILAIVQIAATVLYVTRVGGDFMFARFFIPVTPLVYLAAEETVRGFGRPVWNLAFAVVVVGGTLAARVPRGRIFAGATRVQGITDEPSNYPPGTIAELARQGAVMQRLLGDIGGRIALPPGRTMVGYFGHLPYVLEGSGLTDAEIARQPVTDRGRPGHEKGPSDALLRRRRIPLVLLWGLHRAAVLHPWERLVCDGVACRIVYYDDGLMRALQRKPGVEVVNFPVYLDWYIDHAADVPRDRLRQDVSDFERFYFESNVDPDRRQRLQTILREANLVP